jgi:glyoxylase-like metal-dependent hydrolase (beta-lactamase superfamily II)
MHIGVSDLRQTSNMHCSSIQSPSTVRFCQSTTPASPGIHSIYEPVTGTWQYLVADPSTLEAVIIDSVLDYDPTTRIISTKTADALSSIIDAQNYTITKILETHIHADHLTAASYLQYKLEREQGFRPPICIGRRITQVQELFGRTYNIPQSEYEEVFEQLFADDEEFSIGTLSAKVIHLPGHTADHVGYIVGGKNHRSWKKVIHVDRLWSR